MRSITDVCYGTHEKQRLDIHLPEGDTFPVFLYLHYGGFTKGDKASEVYRPFIEYLTERGICVVSINYRLYPEAKYPDFLEDSAAGVAWAFEHLREYGNPESFWLGGSSAGGYATMMLCFDPSWLGKHGLSPMSLAGFLHDSGQPTTHFNVVKERGMDSKRIVVDEAAPLYYVGTAETLPKMMFVTAETDRENRTEQTLLTLSTLRHFGFGEIPHRVLPGKHVSYVGRLNEAGESEFGRLIYDFMQS
ncbi:MAG: alpha/beta hydrolase [Clostridia bacterium]|nr:alpha/beta hydrolase [Clostridia bacterium]